MNRLELKALRELLCLTVAEAAEHVSQTAKRSWERYESGHQKIHNDVIEQIQMLVLTRQERLQYEYDPDDPNYQYFETLDEFAAAAGVRSVIKWRLAQSVAAELAAEKHAEIWRGREVVDDDQES